MYVSNVMKMRRIFNFLCCAILVCACQEKEGPLGPKNRFVPDENDLKEYTVLSADILRDGNKSGAVQIRIYEDHPAIPYISMVEFHRMMQPGAVISSGWDRNELILHTFDGTAVVNPAEDTFDCDRYNDFTNLMGLVQPGMDNAYLDGAPFIRYNYRLHSNPAPVHFDFKPYGIDIRADEDGVYFPFATLADMYSDLYFHYAICDVNSSLVVIAGRDSDENAIDSQHPAYSLEKLLSKQRPEDMMSYSYGELCFVIDHFYGMPGRSPYEQSIRSKGLDATLESAGVEGKAVKELLFSPNPQDYIAGLEALNIFLGDGGHTKIWNDPDVLLNPDLRYQSDYPDLVSLYRSTFYASLMQITHELISINTMRSLVYGDNNYYHKKGDTAILHFDDFHYINYPAWRAYYAGTGPMPTIENINAPDQMVIFLDALKRAEEDPEVKNLVIDLTMNRGGSSDLVVAMTSLMYGKSFFREENTLTGEQFQFFYDVDRNFDGKFDALDKDVHYDLNFGLLVGRLCFSCGNLFPALCKDEGLLLMGERCGGGGCGVGVYRTPEGFQYKISSARGRLTDEDWQNIDPGIEPQVLIEKGPLATLMLFDGPFSMENLTSFYNLDRLSALMNAYYQ